MDGGSGSMVVDDGFFHFGADGGRDDELDPLGMMMLPPPPDLPLPPLGDAGARFEPELAHTAAAAAAAAFRTRLGGDEAGAGAEECALKGYADFRPSAALDTGDDVVLPTPVPLPSPPPHVGELNFDDGSSVMSGSSGRSASSDTRTPSSPFSATDSSFGADPAPVPVSASDISPRSPAPASRRGQKRKPSSANAGRASKRAAAGDANSRASTGDDEPSDRESRRREGNRIAARRNRERKKQELADLKAEVSSHRTDLALAVASAEQLRAENEALKETLRRNLGNLPPTEARAVRSQFLFAFLACLMVVTPASLYGAFGGSGSGAAAGGAATVSFADGAADAAAPRRASPFSRRLLEFVEEAAVAPMWEPVTEDGPAGPAVEPATNITCAGGSCDLSSTETTDAAREAMMRWIAAVAEHMARGSVEQHAEPALAPTAPVF